MSKIQTSCKQILQHESGPIVCLAFAGEYPPGSLGNSCAAEMITYVRSVLVETNASSILFDFRNLNYTWGDAISGLALALEKDGVFRPSVIVADGHTSRALEALLAPPHVLGVGGMKMFRNMPEAIAYLERKLNESTSVRVVDPVSAHEAFVIADTKRDDRSAPPTDRAIVRRNLSALGERLKHILVERYGRERIDIGNPPDPVMTFQSAHPDVGDLAIMDDVDEATIYIGEITHSHFSCYDSEISEEERAQIIIEDLISFLDDLFADRVLIWAKDTHGGWRTLSGDTVLEPNARNYLWSGPIHHRSAG